MDEGLSRSVGRVVPGGATPVTGLPDASADDLDDTLDERANLAESLSALGQLSTLLGLEDLLIQVARYAVQAVPGADGAGLTLLEPNRSDIVVKSAEFVKQIDDVQYALGEGPCISAAEQGATMRSGALSSDARWPRFGPRAGQLGVQSVLSLPLVTRNAVVGSMNVYAHAQDAFDERAEQLGEIYAVPAAITVHNAQILAQAVRLATRLQAAVTSRSVIDQAIGVLRGRSGITADQAFQRLVQLSQNDHDKLHVVASKLVAEAVRQANSRPRRPN